MLLIILFFKVAKKVVHAITASKPKTRYLVGTDAHIIGVIVNLPDRLLDALFQLVDGK